MQGMEEVPLDREPYPAAKEAVAYHEICGEGFWFVVRAARLGLDETVKKLTRQADMVLEAMPGGLLAAVRPQMDTEDFKRYVAGKLGML